MSTKYSFAFMSRFIILFFVLLSADAGAETIMLNGIWQFRIDRENQGVEQKWYLQKLAEEIKLPGSMAQNGKGDDVGLTTKWTGTIYDSSFYFNPRMAKYRQPGDVKFPFWLTPAKYYVGAAWYQRAITVSKEWSNKRIVIFLERVHIESRLWIDGQEVGKQNSLVAPHTYDVTGLLSPGVHSISIRIDNRVKEINVGPDSHSITDHTQGNWNGIIGRMELQVGSPVHIADIQVYPQVKDSTATVKLKIQNSTNNAFNGSIILFAKSFNSRGVHETGTVSINVRIQGNADSVLTLKMPMGKGMQTWDEFNPALYSLTAALSGRGNDLIDKQQTEFGMREFTISGRQFLINGKPVFLRGTVNSCEFPLTGFPATTIEEWERIFVVAKAHGLNHMRFHSWCPPEAAFRAADRTGFYIQPEGPSWPNHGVKIGIGLPVDQYLYDETDRMATWYGNHASFTMLSAGNEPAGDQVKYLNAFVDYWKAKDPRRVYTGMSVGGSWPVVPHADYQVRGGVRGLNWDKKPESLSDFSAGIAKFEVPFVAHEMGQWCVFPNFDEIKDYTGVYRAKNMELFREDLKDQGMADQAKDFLMASGKLQVLCYKNEIEKVLRTPGYAGFQLLGLQDFPGQGTALVGVLNDFWKDKGYVTAAEFARFCNTTVPLARFPKFVFTNDETLEVRIDVAHSGAAPLQNAMFSWTISDEKHNVIGKGILNAQSVSYGTGIPIGQIRFSLAGINKAAQLKLEVTVNNTHYANDWDFWVYPAVVPEIKSDVYYTTELDDKAKTVLSNGGKVFFNAAGKVVKGKEVSMHFLPVFWNTSWFKMRPPHVTGMLIQNQSPAFTDFPTAFYSDLQWWEIANRSQVMILEDFPPAFKPLVQPIDTWFLNRRLGLVYEARVGKGRLIVSSADLNPANGVEKPAARQLFASLMRYMASDTFNPKEEVGFDVIKDILITPSKFQFSTYTQDSPDELKPAPAYNKEGEKKK